MEEKLYMSAAVLVKDLQMTAQISFEWLAPVLQDS